MIDWSLVFLMGVIGFVIGLVRHWCADRIEGLRQDVGKRLVVLHRRLKAVEKALEDQQQ